MDKKNRVRIAPSPTGYVHIGNFRTILYNYLFAKKTGAEFIVRIEDTDKKRFVNGALESLLHVLVWAGVEYAEGPKLKNNIELQSIESKSYPGIFEVGGSGPYIQSERLEIYKKYAEELVAKGYAYYCFCEPGRLEELRKEQSANKLAPRYDQYCLRNLTEDEINKNLKANCSHVIRLKVPKNETVEFEDIIRGRIAFNTDNIDDQVLLKSDGYPTYHLAVVVDDYEMKVNCVIRGEEWLPSTPKHVLLYRAFGWELPKFAHLPLLLNPDKTKLSKRQGDVAVEDYIKKGYLKEAIINFVALLGWNPGAGETQEIFSLDELVQRFELEKVHKAGAVFDLKKLDWINAQYLKKLSIDELYEKALPFFEQKEFFIQAGAEKKSPEFLRRVLTVEFDRLPKLSDVGENNQFFFATDLNYDKSLLRWKEMTDEDLKKNLEKVQELLGNISEDEWSRESLEAKLLAAAGEKRGELLWPLRAALTGAQKSPSPFEVAWVLGKVESQKRIKKAISLLV
ncbi:MAG: glutamate--tRNA ligase [Candidatus Moraniibacteriota bacterium]